MCGIIGYTGRGDALSRVTAGLYALEYRGYDSAGAAYFCGGDVNVIKTAGRIAELIKLTKGIDSSPNCAIGHTRWATHGAPTKTNAHPHKYGRVTLVHNGIIENHAELKAAVGAHPISETDSEIAAACIDAIFSECGDPLLSVRRACDGFSGSFAIGVMFDGFPGMIYAAKNKSPLIVGISKSGNYIASDVAAIISETDTYIELCDGDVCMISPERCVIIDKRGEEVKRSAAVANVVADDIGLCGYDHFMKKEIAQEPEAIRKTLLHRISDGAVSFCGDGLSDEYLSGIEKLTVVACGTAYHAGLWAKHYIEKTCRIPVDVVVASEYIYGNPLTRSGDTVIFISQSGETADTLSALELASSRGAMTIAVVNVKTSSIARRADVAVFTEAGPEIAVASTKAYTVQCAVMTALGARIAYAKGILDTHGLRSVSRALTGDLCDAINDVIAREAGISAAAKRYHKSDDVYFIGRGADVCACLEASLKLKEISYVHSEAYAAGELKHGTISLITDGTPVIALVGDEKTSDKMMNAIREVASRGADVFAVCRRDFPRDEAIKTRFELPACSDDVLAIAAQTVFQLFAYHTAKLRGCDVDKPRNLAKSVTVE